MRAPATHMTYRITTSALALVLGLTLTSCGEPDRSFTIEEVRDNRKPRIPGGVRLTPKQRLGMRDSRPRGPQFAFDLPTGWKQLPSRQFRDINFTLERDAQLEAYLTILQGGGGGVAHNVNRWRGQFQLDPMNTDAIKELPRKKLFGFDALFLEMGGDFGGMGGGASKADYKLIGYMLAAPEALVTFKMVGPASLIDAERENFIKLATSLRPGTGDPHGRDPHAQDPHGGDPHGRDPHGGKDTRPVGPAGGENGIAGTMQTGASGFQWDVPAGWTRAPDRMMRIVTFHPKGDKSAQCYISQLNGDGGGLAMNVNRWLGEMGQGPIQPDKLLKLPAIKMLGKDGTLIEAYGSFQSSMKGGAAGGKLANAGLLGVACFLPERAIFVKFTGPSELVKAERENFLAFARSIKLSE